MTSTGPQGSIAASLLEEGLSQKIYGAAALYAQTGDATEMKLSVGRQGGKESGEIGDRSLFDLASLTKVLCVTTCWMLLANQAPSITEAPLSRWFPQCPTDKRKINPKTLLAHCSGLPHWRPYYLFKDRCHDFRSFVWKAILREDLPYGPGDRVLYSDLGFMLLHNILELETGVPLDEFFKDSVTRPLGLTDQVMFRPDPREDEIVMTSGSEPPGLVHDLNSRALGGVSGHAGLFGTLRGVVRIAQEILEAIGNRPSIFDHYTALRFSQRASVHGRFMRPMGFDFSSGPASAFGSRPRDGGIGHTGFTGGSLWIDPGYDLIIVILTNRVFMGQDGAMIKEFRQRVHDTLYMELIEKG